MTSYEPSSSDRRRPHPAVFLAATSAIVAGVNAILIKFVTLQLGEVGAVFYVRTFAAMAMLPGFLIISRKASLTPRALGSRCWIFLIGIGVFNALGFVAYAAGLAGGDIAIVVPVAASSPAITVVLAEILLKERIHLHQIMGVFMVLAGVVFLSVASL
jgi:uncharacterized membrane protein